MKIRGRKEEEEEKKERWRGGGGGAGARRKEMSSPTFNSNIHPGRSDLVLCLYFSLILNLGKNLSQPLHCKWRRERVQLNSFPSLPTIRWMDSLSASKKNNVLWSRGCHQIRGQRKSLRGGWRNWKIQLWHGNIIDKWRDVSSYTEY